MQLSSVVFERHPDIERAYMAESRTVAPTCRHMSSPSSCRSLQIFLTVLLLAGSTCRRMLVTQVRPCAAERTD